MPNVAKVLKQEISRLARKEVRAGFTPLKEQIRDLKNLVAQQKKLIARLEERLTQLDGQRAGNGEKDGPAGGEKPRRIRITPRSIKSQRARLHLSQAQLGLLLDVSTNTVVRWETGRTVPRPRHREELARLRTMGVRQVKKLLAEKQQQ